MYKRQAEKWSDLWYIFKPKGFDKTLAEMDSEERENRRKIDGSVPVSYTHLIESL